MPFAAAGFTGEAAASLGLAGADVEREVRRLVDPAAATRTLHWGRNYLYQARCDTPGGPVEVVVKQFRNRHLRDRLRRRFRGSKAARAWAVARALAAAGIATPEPLLLIESERADGPSFYVCRHEAGTEARYLLRAANAGTAAGQFPDIDLARFLTQLGGFVRQLHDAGFWHRDLSSGNVLVRRAGAGAPVAGATTATGTLPPPAGAATPGPETAGEAAGRPGGPGEEPYELYLVDLNRTRSGRRPTLSERARDLSRMNLLRPEHRRLYLQGYWGAEGAEGSVPALGGALYALYFHGFLWKNRLKKVLRRGRAAAPTGVVRIPHAHIPEAPAGAAARDQIVWDRLSDQPHQHAGRVAKARVRLADLAVHAAAAATVARALPRVWRRYRELPRELYGGVVPWSGAGIGLRPWSEEPEALLALIEELGARHVLLRLHPWESDHAAEEELAAELHRRGYELTFALPQNRELVRDPARWRAALARLGERFAPYGRRFQVGQAINRSKWGVWNRDEYLELARGADEVLRRHPGVELLGPAAIDFEYHAALAVLDAPGAGFSFDAVSALLYVDRRGAPEARQMGFDTPDKVRLLRAVADTARNVRRTAQGRGSCWITEVNWPLWEGPHSPAGRAVAVDEERQADYLARYYLLCLGTGLVERVFWWQLVARGYGLVDPAEPGSPSRPRRRPSFHALRTLLRELAGSRFEEALPVPAPARLWRFRRPDGSDLAVGWSPEPRRGALPRPAVRAVARGGEELAAPDPRAIALGPAPVYYHLV